MKSKDCNLHSFILFKKMQLLNFKIFLQSLINHHKILKGSKIKLMMIFFLE